MMFNQVKSNWQVTSVLTCIFSFIIMHTKDSFKGVVSSSGLNFLCTKVQLLHFRNMEQFVYLCFKVKEALFSSWFYSCNLTKHFLLWASQLLFPPTLSTFSFLEGIQGHGEDLLLHFLCNLIMPMKILQPGDLYPLQTIFWAFTAL